MCRLRAPWPIGTRQRVWLDILPLHGLRRGDVVRLGRQHVRGGVATLKTRNRKAASWSLCRSWGCSNARSPPDLAAISRSVVASSANRSPRNRLAISFRGVPRRRPHGKVCAWRAQDRGDPRGGNRRHGRRAGSDLGWRGGAIASLYTREANRARLAKEGMHKLENERQGDDAEKIGMVRFWTLVKSKSVLLRKRLPRHFHKTKRNETRNSIPSPFKANSLT